MTDNHSPILTSLLGLLAIAGVIVAGFALWPDSEAEKARADGEDLGVAVESLFTAESSAEVESAQDDVQAALDSTAEHGYDAVYSQASDQVDALDRAVDGYVGQRTTDSSWDQELYELELDLAADDLENNAEDFQTNAPEVQEAFWEGYEDGRAGNV